MKHTIFMLLGLAMCLPAAAVEATSPDGKLALRMSCDESGRAFYSILYDGETMLEESPLGFTADTGDFVSGLKEISHTIDECRYVYDLDRAKHSHVERKASRLVCHMENAAGRRFDIVFSISDNDVAFRYEIPQTDWTACCRIESEATGFDLPSDATAYVSPQSPPMTGWHRTKPSYEEEYAIDVPLGTPSLYGCGFTFPALFDIGGRGWVLISETGVDGRYCGSHLSDSTDDGTFTVQYPDKDENNGYGTPYANIALPGHTPWRTVTVGRTLAPIVETTVMFDVVTPLFDTSHGYRFGRSTWSWIIWQDASVNYDDQRTYIDLAADMGYEYVLIDGLWDKQIGRERMGKLFDYARRRGVGVFLWYNSNGYWNDAPQGAKQCMSSSIARKSEMRWLRDNGVKGIKVDFFGGDKQTTMQLYEDILSDADDYGLMVIFHGCTLPRGWERMYPNYVGSEAVLASENLIFYQHFADREAVNATLHPFIRNAVGAMEYGGTLLNRRLNRTNDGGTIRRTGDIFQTATAVLFQNPIQNFALTPQNIDRCEPFVIDFMRNVPTTWDETRFVAGHPGRYCVVARRHGTKWYVAGINATDETLNIEFELPCRPHKAALYADIDPQHPHRSDIYPDKDGKVRVAIVPQGGIVITANEIQN